jgi:hypothetical protein
MQRNPRNRKDLAMLAPGIGHPSNPSRGSVAPGQDPKSNLGRGRTGTEQGTRTVPERPPPQGGFPRAGRFN